jgi:hypothetical protein
MSKNKLRVYEIKVLKGIDLEHVIKTFHEKVIDIKPIKLSYYQSDNSTIMVLSDELNLDQLKNVFFELAKVEIVMEV